MVFGRQENNYVFGKHTKKEIIFELKAVLRDDLAREIEKNGAKSSILNFTDVDNQQICIKLDENVYIYSQQNEFFYNCYTDNDTDIKAYYTEKIDLSILSLEGIKNEISGFYNSIEEVKKIYAKNYKQILAECIFENHII